MKKRGKVNKIINLVIIVIIIFCISKICLKLYDYKVSQNAYRKIRAIKSDASNNQDNLKKINEDYVGWIEVANTNIDYPVVQGKDNDFYLNHDFNKNKSSSGSIFIDYRNNIDKDKNIVIYGHNMKNKSMFQNLMKFKEEEFWEENNKIILTIDGKKYEYEIFSYYVINAKDIDLKANFKNDGEYLKYIEGIKKKSIFHRDIDITSNDKIITLSTCSYEKNDFRISIYGRLKSV